MIVEGVAGTSVDLYGSVNLASNGFAGFVDGSPSNSINALCCGDNTLSVGAYVNTNPYPSLGGMMTFGESRQVGDIAYFSSYGHTFQGRQLPDVVGPGMGMISSYNSYYVAQEIASYIEMLKKPAEHQNRCPAPRGGRGFLYGLDQQRQSARSQQCPRHYAQLLGRDERNVDELAVCGRCAGAVVAGSR